jgi:hypothetical protein
MRSAEWKRGSIKFPIPHSEFRIQGRPMGPPHPEEAQGDLRMECSSRRCFLRVSPLPPGHKFYLAQESAHKSEGEQDHPRIRVGPSSAGLPVAEYSGKLGAREEKRSAGHTTWRPSSLGRFPPAGRDAVPYCSAIPLMASVFRKTAQAQVGTVPTWSVLGS